ncbi:MAG: polyribonucleotide nucleotidyltransferase [SAR202 cluster bacterium]|nr:polyribonucleotide nucleotidyltransferase [SAR202 cluster bacterium]
MSSPTSVELEVGGRTLTISTGQLAQQATGAVTVRYGDTVVLVTAVMGGIREGVDFFPLTVDYEERLYAVGRVPGSFFRREGRPTTEAILSGRLTDRPLRPRFPKGMRNDVQVITTVLSVDLVNQPDILSIIGASAALSISSIPFDGPIAGTRMGYLDGEFIVNPTYEQLSRSALDLTVAGSRDAIIMIEAGAKEVPEDVVLEAMRLGQENNVRVIELQERLVLMAGQPKATVATPADVDPALEKRAYEVAAGRVADIVDRGEGKGERSHALEAIEKDAVEALKAEFDPKEIAKAFYNVQKKVVRSKVLNEGKRPDGRKPHEVRPLSSQVGLIPRTHGSALFQRGETQVLTLTTLGSLSMEQKLDGLSPEDTKRYIHHYNFPPYSVGEVRRLGTGRREVGHGALAERALEPVIPDESEFPYVLRVVSEVLGSNGSTSMGSVCGSTLSLMDAGVPIKAPVSGVAMGLMTDEGGKYTVLTDIQGVEDFFGDMDFKVAGTASGITALQMDIKVSGITMEVMKQALTQAKDGRSHILNHMLRTLSNPRPELNPYAPRMLRMQIPIDKIGALIGPGGKNIRGIIEQTGCTIDVEDDGSVIIGSTDKTAADQAIAMINALTKEVEVGQVYTGRVTRLMNFGAFVEILPGKEGLVHISELSTERVGTVEDAVKVGDTVEVMVSEIDRMGRINLSRRAVLQNLTPDEMREQVAARPQRDGGDRPRGGFGGGRGGPRPGGGGGFRDRGPRRDFDR